MEHPGPVVPVGEDPFLRPAIAHDVVEAEIHQLRQRRALGLGHVRLADVGVGIEDVVVGGGDVEVAADDRRLGPGGDHLAQRGQPDELVRVVLGTRLAPVRHVHRDDPDPATGGRHRARLRIGEARRPGDAGLHVVESHAREDRHPVPRRLAVNGDGVVALGELVREQLAKRVVGELRLLQADDVRLPLVQPGQSRGRRCLTELTFQVAIRTAVRIRARPLREPGGPANGGGSVGQGNSKAVGGRSKCPSGRQGGHSAVEDPLAAHLRQRGCDSRPCSWFSAAELRSP